jgi:hypothetical protein
MLLEELAESTYDAQIRATCHILARQRLAQRRNLDVILLSTRHARWDVVLAE